MTDHKEIMVENQNNGRISRELDDMVKHAVLHELATRLCESIDLVEEYREQFECGLTEGFCNTLRGFSESNDDLCPTAYGRRQKILVNRLFRYRNIDILPFPEVDTPYERLRFKIAKRHKIKLHCIRKEHITRNKQ